MSKSLNTFLFTTVILALSLYLAACGKDEKAKPAMEKAAPSQVTQPAAKPETTPETQAPEISQPAASEPSSTTTTTTPKVETPPVAQQTSTNREQMLNLARKSGCHACHSVNKKLVGPAWNDIAARYKAKADARTLLIEKVSKGGRGSWTDVVGNVAMPPYSPRVSKENIERLVDFILSL